MGSFNNKANQSLRGAEKLTYPSLHRSCRLIIASRNGIESHSKGMKLLGTVGVHGVEKIETFLVPGDCSIEVLHRASPFKAKPQGSSNGVDEMEA